MNCMICAMISFSWWKIKVTEILLLKNPIQIIKDINSSLSKKKLIPDLGSKRKYKLHSQNLALYLNSGLQLKKIIEY